MKSTSVIEALVRNIGADLVAIAEDGMALASIEGTRKGLSAAARIFGGVALAILAGMSLVTLCSGLAELIATAADLSAGSKSLVAAAIGLLLTGIVASLVAWRINDKIGKMGGVSGEFSSKKYR